MKDKKGGLKKYQIKFRRMGYLNRRCGFCGGLFETGDVTGYLTDKTDRRIFLICEDCLKAGIKEFPSILKNHTEYLKKRAAFLEDLSNQTIEYSKDEYERLKKEAEEEWKRIYAEKGHAVSTTINLEEIPDLEPF